MAQSNFEERIDTYEIESTNVMTGDRDRSRYLYYQLKMSMAKAKQIDIIVSFLMESGVRMLLNDMKRALDRGVKIRILTGNYLGITQPSALYLIKSELGDRVDLRLYNETSRSFHPKSYIFHYESSNEIYIGSSNISKSALTSGIEWNYRFSDTLDKKNYELFYATFEDLFLNHSIIIDDEELKRYSKAWKKPAVSRDLTKYDAAEDSGDENVRMLYRPRGAQIEALYVSDKPGYNNMAIGMYAGNSGNTLYCPTGYLELLRLQDRFVYLPEMPYRKVDLDKAKRNVLTQEEFTEAGGKGNVAGWLNTVTVENVHPNTTVAIRMKGIAGKADTFTLYAYDKENKLKEVPAELWHIQEEDGTLPDKLTEDTLYEVHVMVEDGGEFDLSDTEKEIKIAVILGNK